MKEGDSRQNSKHYVWLTIPTVKHGSGITTCAFQQAEEGKKVILQSSTAYSKHMA